MTAAEYRHQCSYYCQDGWHCTLVWGEPFRDGWDVLLHAIFAEFEVIDVCDVHLVRELPPRIDDDGEYHHPWLVWFRRAE